MVLTKRVDLRNRKRRKTRNLDVHETKKRKYILDGFELGARSKEPWVLWMASVSELPRLPCRELP